MDYAFNFAKAKKVTTEDKYPYTSSQSSCKIATGTYATTGYVDVPANNP